MSGDDLTATALACSGLVALLGLPALLIASMAIGAPLAAPAAIASGYLATSYAIASENRRSAAAISAFVLVGLVVWSLGVMSTGETTRAELVAALLAPLFAAAPWLARLTLARRADPAARTARRSTECLDRLAPGAMVLIVQRDGTLLSATRAARANLRLSDSAIGRDVARSVGVLDRPKLSAAMAQSAPGEEPITITFQEGWAGGSTSACTAEVSSGEGGTVCIRLAPAAAAVEADGESVACAAGRAAEEEASSSSEPGPACDAAEAADFALRRFEAAANARQVMLTASVEPSIAVRCERQICRRILVLMMEAALARAEPGDRLHLTVRALKSVVLLRLAVEREMADGKIEQDALDLSAIRQLAETVGGTAVADGAPAEAQISVRFDLANTTWREAA